MSAFSDECKKVCDLFKQADDKRKDVSYKCARCGHTFYFWWGGVCPVCHGCLREVS